MLYKILKAAKLGAATAPDMLTGLLAQKMPFAKGDGEIAELSGVPPLRFKSNGKPLLDWHIIGNTIQNGTPTLSNPVSVQGVGELEISGEHSGEYKIPISNGQQTTNIYLGSTPSTRQIKKLVLDGSELWAAHATRPNLYTLNSVSDYLHAINPAPICSHYSAKTVASAAAVENNNLALYYNSTQPTTSLLYIKDEEIATVADLKSYLADQHANGTPVTVWYVLATPQTATINEPLQKIGEYADSVNMADTGIVITTVRGNNVLTVDTTVQPSEVYIKYQK